MAEDAPLRPARVLRRDEGGRLAAARRGGGRARACAPPVLRAFQVYGPQRPARAACPDGAARGPLRARSLPLTGPGLRRDWVHVDDVVEACVLAAARRRPAGRPGAQRRHRRADRQRGAGRARRAGHRPPHPRRGRRAPRPRLGHRLAGSATRSRRAALLGWEPPARPARRAGPCWAASVRVAVVVPVYGNAATLAPLVDRLAAALAGRAWRLRLVVDASPDDSARSRAGSPPPTRGSRSPCWRVNVGQHRALAAGLPRRTTPTRGSAWTPTCRTRPRPCRCCSTGSRSGDVAAVFAGRRGGYESRLRLLTGRLHRALMARSPGCRRTRARSWRSAPAPARPCSRLPAPAWSPRSARPGCRSRRCRSSARPAPSGSRRGPPARGCGRAPGPCSGQCASAADVVRTLPAALSAFAGLLQVALRAGDVPGRRLLGRTTPDRTTRSTR